ncbi:GyrI-like domain-containing protein [Caldilinea sp.]|uniref:GyrI-like domain-containing protein n=1 Tax=Caldilinea sp. TaxID=2293560 RepID=UPI002CCE0BBE|nr:GyrI-like domain-containing protein [Caldilinea sp.]HRA66523.1 GyrI-like domain-containing protein [Caldilinea sp.]
MNYRVAPLEGLWWGDDMDVFITANRAAWRWTMMIAQPSPVTQVWMERAFAEVQRKKQLSALPHVRFAAFHEGLAAQIMHVGPYATEAPTIQRLRDFIQAQGGRFTQKHHEIYLGDPRRTAPAKLKTVLRQPFAHA